MKKTIVNPISRATAKLGCTQSVLAERLGVSTGLVSMWKRRGYITQRHLAKACAVTGLQPHELNPFIPQVRASRKQAKERSE